jgi:uncharacterized membrane protein
MKTAGIVPMILPFHIVAGVLALAFGYVALFAAKGATLHRKSGMLFVFAMVTLSLTGALVAFLSASSCCIGCGAFAFEKHFSPSSASAHLRSVEQRND